ncbi:hypothetical protein HDU84_008441 [Entophlyctis sp. JEL0112]|nr:hypothetical protein HDU84_008441 [Entophlyctis sp. JEL0112]
MSNSNTSGYNIPINPAIIDEIDAQARRIAAEIDKVISHFEQMIEEMASHAVESAQIHGEAVEMLCDTLDGSCSSTVELIHAVDGLSEDMGGVMSLSSQIRVLKEAVDALERHPALR